MAEENKQENAEDEIIIIEEDQASSVDGNAQEKQEKQTLNLLKIVILMIFGFLWKKHLKNIVLTLLIVRKNL